MRAALGLTRHFGFPREQITQSTFRLFRLAAAFQTPQANSTSHRTRFNTRNMSVNATNAEEISFL
jgi:hypothetical protein